MFPVLFSVGPFSVSSFGLFLALAFLSAVFVSWRLAKAYDVSEEKIFDLAILTFLGGLVGARVYFVVQNWGFFDDLWKVLLVNRYPGLSFWGGFAGGSLALWYFSKRFKLNFWQIADFAAVGFLAGQILGNIGCFLGGCSYGIVSEWPIAVPVVGLIGKRLPVALIESILLLVAFFYLWGQVVKFHFSGKIIALSLAIMGAVKFVTEFYRGDLKPIISSPAVSLGHLFSIILLVTGIVIFYLRSKRVFLADLKALPKLISSEKKREVLLSSVKKSWYNNWTAWKVGAGKMTLKMSTLPKKLKRRLNVKSTPTNIN